MPEDPVVEPELVEPLPPPPPRTFFHPLSGLVILGVDWLAFGADFVSGLFALLLTSLAAFTAVFFAVYRVQTRLNGDAPGKARWKALLGALAAGVPFPVAGTVVGAAILVLSGLPSPSDFRSVLKKRR